MLYMNIDEIMKFHQDLLNQQRDHKSIQKETIKLVNMLNKNINLMSDKLDELIEKGRNFQFDDKTIKNTLENSTSLFDNSTRLLNGVVVNLTETDLSESTGEDSEDEKETIQIKKKPKIGNGRDKESDECSNQQRLFNKFVRESVEQKLGTDFLLNHEIQEIDPDIMEEIRKSALSEYPPINIRPRRAWHLAKASLRCRRRSLRRQKEKQQTNSLNNNHQSVNLEF